MYELVLQIFSLVKIHSILLHVNKLNWNPIYHHVTFMIYVSDLNQAEGEQVETCNI